jgi:arylsulfatase A-like enzyme
LGNWDTHQDNFDAVKGLARQCDPALAALIADLKQRGLFDKTLIVWTGEFGRTPRVNPRTGRDHWPRNFNAPLAGGGVKGGQVIGETSKDGTSLVKDPVSVPDLFCSICKSLEVNPSKENMSPLGRPMKIVDGGKPVDGLFA